jgi:hypothetical protein
VVRFLACTATGRARHRGRLDVQLGEPGLKFAEQLVAIGRGQEFALFAIGSNVSVPEVQFVQSDFLAGL